MHDKEGTLYLVVESVSAEDNVWIKKSTEKQGHIQYFDNSASPTQDVLQTQLSEKTDVLLHTNFMNAMGLWESDHFNCVKILVVPSLVPASSDALEILRRHPEFDALVIKNSEDSEEAITQLSAIIETYRASRTKHFLKSVEIINQIERNYLLWRGYNIEVIVANIDKLSMVKTTYGWSNTSFILSLDDVPRYVLRRFSKHAELFLDRSTERMNARLAHEWGFYTTIHYSDDEVFLTDYISNIATVNIDLLKNINYVTAVTQALKKLHQSDQKFENVLDTEVRSTTVLEKLVEEGISFPQEFDALKTSVREIYKAFSHFPITPVPCHGDPTPSNFLALENGTVKILDWENSGMCDPFWDLGCLAVEGEFDQEQEEKMLASYEQSFMEDKEKIARLVLNKILFEYWLCLWLKYQIYTENPIHGAEFLEKVFYKKYVHCINLTRTEAYKTAKEYFDYKILKNSAKPNQLSFHPPVVPEARACLPPVSAKSKKLTSK